MREVFRIQVNLGKWRYTLTRSEGTLLAIPQAEKIPIYPHTQWGNTKCCYRFQLSQIYRCATYTKAFYYPRHIFNMLKNARSDYFCGFFYTYFFALQKQKEEDTSALPTQNKAVTLRNVLPGQPHIESFYISFSLHPLRHGRQTVRRAVRWIRTPNKIKLQDIIHYQMTHYQSEHSFTDFWVWHFFQYAEKLRVQGLCVFYIFFTDCFPENSAYYL